MNDGSNPLTWDAQFLSYWFSRNPMFFQDSVLRHRKVVRAKELSAPPPRQSLYRLRYPYPHQSSIATNFKETDFARCSVSRALSVHSVNNNHNNMHNYTEQPSAYWNPILQLKQYYNSHKACVSGESLPLHKDTKAFEALFASVHA
jgi:hypothetical protein